MSAIGRASEFNEWIKFVKGGSAEIVITGFEEGLLGPHSVIHGTDRNGVPVQVKTLNDEWRADFAKHAAKYVGRTLVISYRDKTRDGKYKHGMADHII